MSTLPAGINRSPPAQVRWLVRHGLIRRTVTRQMRAGDLGARLMMDPALREDPYPSYDELRARGPIVPSGISLISAHHAAGTTTAITADIASG